MPPTYISYTHQVAGKTFNVIDGTVFDQQTMTPTRKLVVASSGEVLREWSLSPGTWSMPPYDFPESERWLQERYGPTYGANNSPTVAGASYMTTHTNFGTLTISNGSITATKLAQQPIITTPALAVEDATQSENEDDMLRDNFTFPYTGAEIAAGLEAKAAALDAQIKSDVVIDRATATLLGYSTDDAYEELVKDKQMSVDRKNTQVRATAAEMRTEARPYAKAADESFDLDLDDVKHFGLDAEDAPAPAPKVRKRRVAKAVVDA